MQEYDLTVNGQAAGTVQLSRQGLYYEISCRCNQALDTGYKLIVKGERGEASLGGFVPVLGEMHLQTRIPIKQIGEGELSFRAESKDTVCRIHLQEDKPIPCIEKLEQCRLAIENGVLYLVYQTRVNPTGQ